MRPEIKLGPHTWCMDIFDLLNSFKKSYFFNYFFGQTKGSFLIGPSFHKKICTDCFLTRLESSSFVDKNTYLSVTQRVLKSILKFKHTQPLNLENKMVEFDKKTGKVVFIHYLFCIPGCPNM